MEIELTRRQLDFIEADADEVLFGGAAGGGKSWGQLIDALVYALRHDRSRQLVLRRSLVELERTLIPLSLTLFPRAVYSYNAARHTGTFANGSTVEFGYCDADGDALRYQSAEYDVLRFDELTHFSERAYTYLMSRVRGANGYPKQIKSTTNPGGPGHDWVKRRFIDLGAWGEPHDTPTGTRIFLPARAADNIFLARADGNYVKRLMNLDEPDRRALALGEWNIDAGRYFSEWRADVHVVEPFALPVHWRRYFTMDYGLDMFAGYFVAVDDRDRAVVYRELYEPDLIISAAAERILACGEPVDACFAPPDLWNRRQESGVSAAELFLEHGVALTKAPAARAPGFLAMRERLRVFAGETGALTAGLVFFPCCVNAIRTVAAIQRDDRNPNDCAREPHERTHAPDALRYFVASTVGRHEPAQPGEDPFQRQLTDLIRYTQ
ncbi:MAG: terminase family protein [Oscillospiraceae bacterium]|nr:terminase family protein [Oscillospiraceae bacterium]